MKNRLLTIDVWTRIKTLSRHQGRKLVAVPYLGTGARKQLTMQYGDVLIVRFDAPTVQSGAVDPREILHYLKEGVDVHSVENLHAKVLVLGRTAIIGSTNISHSSEHSLIEAAVETTDTCMVKAASDFVYALRGDTIEPQFAKRMLKLYKAPRLPRKSPQPARNPTQSVLWAVPLEEAKGDAEYYRNAKLAKSEAKKSLQNPSLFGITEFRWWRRPFLDELKLGHRVMMMTFAHNRTVVHPPGRVIAIRRYASERSRPMIVCLEMRHRLRPQGLHAFMKKMGAAGNVLNMLIAPLKIRNPLLTFKIGAAWPTSVE